MASLTTKRYNEANMGENPGQGERSETATSERFHQLFRRWARRVAARLAARGVVGGVTVGLSLGAGAAAAAWYFGQGPLRPFGAAFGLLGAVGGYLWARRRAWSDDDVALYLDRKLASDEAIATAVSLDDDAPARAVVVQQATEALDRDPPRGVWPRVLRGWHLASVAAVAGIAWVSLAQLPPPPEAPPPPPGSGIVTVDDLEGLDEVIELANLDPKDDAQRQRLKDISERAKRLREQLREGMEKRAAQEELARLREAIANERKEFGSGEQRRGLEAAMSKLGQDPQLKEAERALGDRDLTKFDEEMEKLANKLEEADREEAKKALEEAAKAAEKEGAKDVAKELREQQKLMDERAKRAEKLRELAKAFADGLSDEAKKALENMNGSGDAYQS